MKSLKSILAVKLADMGDALLIVPALRALKTAYPAARLEVLTTATGRAGLDGLPYIDQLLVFDKYQFDSPGSAFSPQKAGQVAGFMGNLRLKKYDAIIFFHHFSLRWGLLKYRALATASGATWRVGLDNGKPLASFLNVRVQDKGFGTDGLTERDYWRQLVEALLQSCPGQPFIYDESPEIAIAEADKAQAVRLRREIIGDDSEQPVIALGPGGGGYSLTRRWPAANFARLADMLVQKYRAKIVILGSADEQILADQIRAQTSEKAAIVSLAGKTSLKELAAFLEDCDLLIGNDGGLAQLAGISNTSAVVIFGPTNSIAWSPFGTETGRVKIGQAEMDLPCRPCLYRGQNLGSRLGCAPRPCLTTITPPQIFQIAQELLVEQLLKHKSRRNV